MKVYANFPRTQVLEINPDCKLDFISSPDFNFKCVEQGWPKRWDFRDDCTEFKLSVSLYLWFPGNEQGKIIEAV